MLTASAVPFSPRLACRCHSAPSLPVGLPLHLIYSWFIPATKRMTSSGIKLGLPAFAMTTGVAALVWITLFGAAAQTAESGELRGTIRDAQGRPVAGATLRLQGQDESNVQTALTDAQGSYHFSALPPGVYRLHAEMKDRGDASASSIFVKPKEAKSLDLVLSVARAPAFYDQPQFTVSGVTDTTTLGGHGSDTTVRTRDTLAKETAVLAKTSASPHSAAMEQSLRERVHRAPGSFEANHQLGGFLVQSGKPREAIPYLEVAAKLNPEDYENRFDLALANSDSGNYVRAREDARELLQHHDAKELHHLLAEVQEKLGNSLDAVHEYQQAAESNPSEPYLFDWGAELLLHHAPEPALEVFTRGNHSFPRSSRVLIGMGASLFALGSYDAAVQRICEASDLDPENPIPYEFLAKMDRAQSAPSDPLVEHLRRFVALHPESAEARYSYAVALWNRRKNSPSNEDWSHMESLLTEAVRLNPRFGAAYLQLGILRAEQRDFPGAIARYEQAIRTVPQLEEAHYRLAQAYRQTGEGDKAKAELRTYDQISKDAAQRAERERHEIRQFVYTLRDQRPQTP